jgi:hypothetical protein
MDMMKQDKPVHFFIIPSGAMAGQAPELQRDRGNQGDRTEGGSIFEGTGTVFGKPSAKCNGRAPMFGQVMPAMQGLFPRRR